MRILKISPKIISKVQRNRLITALEKRDHLRKSKHPYLATNKLLQAMLTAAVLLSSTRAQHKNTLLNSHQPPREDRHLQRLAPSSKRIAQMKGACHSSSSSSTLCQLKVVPPPRDYRRTDALTPTMRNNCLHHRAAKLKAVLERQEKGAILRRVMRVKVWRKGYSSTLTSRSSSMKMLSKIYKRFVLYTQNIYV